MAKVSGSPEASAPVKGKAYKMTKEEMLKEKTSENYSKGNWFTESFLPSLEKRMKNSKYPNQCILSEKQAEVCYLQG